MISIPYIFGAANEEEVGIEILRYSHDFLFCGDLIFAYINKGQHLVIVKYRGVPVYGLSLITSGYTALIPKIPKEYIESFSIDCLNDIGGVKSSAQELKEILNNINN